LRLFLIYRKNEPYKIIKDLNVDFEDYIRFDNQFHVKNDFSIKEEKDKFILKIKDKNFILKNENKIIRLPN